MADLEQVALLKTGVKNWNRWRDKNLNIKPDISGADFIGANLSKVNFSEANLSQTNLQEVYLIGSDLRKTNLKQAILRKADLRWANFSLAEISEANLKESDLSGSNLSRANLSRANLSRANLSRANLSGANLSGANLSRADFSGADFSGADFSGADFSGVDFNGADFSGADFSEADFNGANLSGANLSRANLSGANLIRTQALGTDFTGAKFTGACLEDWNINSATKLDNIDCQYIYLRHDKQERRPSSGEFAPGEFTKLFQKALETVDLIFADGIDWKGFLLSFQELQAEYGEENLSVQAIEKKSDGAFVIRLEASPETNKAKIETQAKELYEHKMNALEAKYHKELKAKDEQIAVYRQQNATLENIIYILGNRPIQNIISAKPNAESKSISEAYQSKYDQRNSNNQFVDTAQTGSNPTFNQKNFSQKINQNIDDITRLINSLREKAQEFPQDKCEEILVHLDDLQEDISKPEKQKPERIKTRIIALIAVASTVFGVVANSADFTNNVLEIADKLGIPIPTEISQPQRAIQQLPPPTH